MINDENPVNIFVLKRKKRPTITRRFFYFFQDVIVIPQIVSHDSILPQPSNHYSLHSKLLSFIEYGTVRNKNTNIYLRQAGSFWGNRTTTVNSGATATNPLVFKCRICKLFFFNLRFRKLPKLLCQLPIIKFQQCLPTLPLQYRYSPSPQGATVQF